MDAHQSRWQWSRRDWLGHCLDDVSWLWLTPRVPLPSPMRLRALTHRPCSWWVLAYLIFAGNGIPAGRVH